MEFCNLEPGEIYHDKKKQTAYEIYDCLHQMEIPARKVLDKGLNAEMSAVFYAQAGAKEGEENGHISTQFLCPAVRKMKPVP